MMAQARSETRQVNFSTYLGSLEWLSKEPREAAVTIAARSALRLLPTIVTFSGDSAWPDSLELSAFRAAMIAWVAAKYPKQRSSLRSAATAAARAAETSDRASNADAAAASAAAAHAAAAPDTSRDELDAASQAADATTYCANHKTVIDAVAADAEFISRGTTSGERAILAINLADTPLWSDDYPASSIMKDWVELRSILEADHEGWEVWVNWYEDRLTGRPSLGEAFDLAVATLPDNLWEQGPKAVNDSIKELIAEYSPPELIPAQGAGPHFALNPELKIALASPTEIDAHGNNIGRINNLLPVVRQAANDLAGHLNPNTQPEISRNLTEYRAAIAGEPRTIAWGMVFGLGVRLENAAAAAERQIVDRLHEPMEDAAQEALESLRTLHGPLIRASAEGRELSDEADEFRLTREQQAALRADAEMIGRSFKSSPEIIEPAAAAIAEEAAETIGRGAHPERGAVFGLATIKNAATLLLPAATLGAVHWVISQSVGGGDLGIAAGTAAASFVGFKAAEIGRVRAAARALGEEFAEIAGDQAGIVRAQTIARLRLLTPFRDFVTRNEAPLRRIAENTGQLRWMLRYIEFIVRSNLPKE